ncbi:MAG: hypothetical protein LBH25_09340 [Fibromonadaceae bacterium]|nr:hypothetical protein [Fibromonadaceae bacterium]
MQKTYISSLTGKVTIKFTIAPGGDIVSINIVSSTTGDSKFDIRKL